MPAENSITATARGVAEDYRQVFGEELVSVTLYGSALTEEFVPKKSDLNFLVVLSENGIEQLDLAQHPVARWRKKRVGTPLFLTRAYIESSLETFPIEFLNIKRNYRVIWGQDVLAELRFEKEHVRLQCERELKGKLLLLRQRYVETSGKTSVLTQLIADSLPTFVFVFKALLYLLDREVPATKLETVRAVCSELQLDERLFSTLLEIKGGKLRPGKRETEEIFRRYLREVRRLALLMDERDFTITASQA